MAAIDFFMMMRSRRSDFVCESPDDSPSMMTLISVVIPTYNRVSDLKRALRSVIAQTHTNWEAVVVDNYSNDDTEEMVRALGDSRIAFHRMRNEGVIASSRNCGIQYCRGEFVAFLDSDDWWTADKLAVALEYLRGGADIVYHDLRIITKSAQRLSLKKTQARQVISPVYSDLIVNGNAIATSSVVVRRQRLAEIGGFSEDRELIAAEDYDCWLRLSQITEKFTLIPKVLGFYWLGGGNATKPERSLKNLARLRELHINDFIETNDGKVPIWAEYHLGRSLYLTHSYFPAAVSLRLLLRRRTPLTIKLKIWWMLAVMYMNPSDAVSE